MAEELVNIIYLLTFLSFLSLNYSRLSLQTKSIINIILVSESFVLFFYSYTLISSSITFFTFLLSLYFVLLNTGKASTNVNEGLLFSLFSRLHIENHYHYVAIFIMPLILYLDLSNNSTSETGILILLFCIFLIVIKLTNKKSILKFSDEIDFIFLFLTLLTSLFVSASLLDLFSSYSLFLSDLNNRQIHIELFLSKPLTLFLKMLGFTVWSEGNILYYEDLESAKISSVLITKGCSGLYSVTIFFCCFLSYIFKFRSTNWQMIMLWSVFGISISYISNLFRMAIIVIVGHYYGPEMLVFVHKNIGWLFFTLWVALFWYFFEKYGFK